MLSPQNGRKVVCERIAGYDSDCYLQFSRGSAPLASVRQDVSLSTKPGDNLTGEARVRCPYKFGEACPINLTIRGMGGPGDETRSTVCTIPDDGAWYVVRLDGNNNFIEGFGHEHSTIRWELYNEGSPTRNIDVDYTTLADGYAVAVEGVNFPPTASPGKPCEEARMTD